MDQAALTPRVKTAPPPILNRKLRGQDYRLLFWLLAQQDSGADGIPNGYVAVGWRDRVRVEMDLPDSQIFRSIQRLKKAGVVSQAAWKKDLRIEADAFNL